MTTITIRPATMSDVPLLRRITIDTELGEEAPSDPSALDQYLGHLVRHGTVAVAEAHGDAIGFGGTVDTGRSRHLADLFVLPGRQGQGIGRRLLDVVFDDVWPRTTFGSDDPRAVPLYIRAGMDALWSNLYLAGDPASLPAIDRRLTVHEASGPEVAALEADWIGADRRPHLEYWASLPDVRIVVIRRGVAVVGTAIGRWRLSGRGRWMHHAVAAPGEDGPSILLAAMHAGLAGAEVGGGCIPSPSPLVRTLLEAGFRITDRDTYLASDPAIVDPYREIVNTGFL